MTERLATPASCISIDVDPVPCYYRIHGLGPAPASLRHRIALSALPRFANLFAEARVRATFFVVGEDLHPSSGAEHRDVRTLVRELSDAGHEIASHSFRHPYELARLSAERVEEELAATEDCIGEVTGKRVLGFRAPGYDLSPILLAALIARGYRYDSSVFPAPGYYLAKAAIMGWRRLVGRPSGAVMTQPRALFAPIEPYRVCVETGPFAVAPPGAHALWELPIAVTRATRTPVIGTNLLLAPEPLFRHWMHAMARRTIFNFELHGIDLCHGDRDRMPSALVASQPDLRVPLPKKVQRLAAILKEMEGGVVQPLCDYVETLLPD